MNAFLLLPEARMGQDAWRPEPPAQVRMPPPQHARPSAWNEVAPGAGVGHIQTRRPGQRRCQTCGEVWRAPAPPCCRAPERVRNTGRGAGAAPHLRVLLAQRGLVDRGGRGGRRALAPALLQQLAGGALRRRQALLRARPPSPAWSGLGP